MTSILKVDNLQDASGTGTPYIKDAVLQVKQGILTTTWASSASSTAFEDTPLSVTITPKSTSSKILITGMINFTGESSGHVDFKIVRGGADILLSTQSIGNRTKSHLHYYFAAGTDSLYQIITGNINLLDSPASTSALTYTLQAATPYVAGHQALLNQVGSDHDAVYNAYTVSTLTAMEIGG
jgi:hypothetical protein